MIPLKQGERYYDADDNEWYIVELAEQGTDGPELRALLVRADGSPRAEEVVEGDLRPPRWRRHATHH